MLSPADAGLTTGILAATIYRIASIAAGVALCWMGYRLFTVGIFAEAGDAEGKWGNKRIILKRAAPGTFFALFGAIVLSLAINKGIAISNVPGTMPKSSEGSTDRMILDRSLPLSGMPNPSEVEKVMEKVRKGEPLTDADRKQLDTWYEGEKEFYKQGTEGSWGVKVTG